jgi:DNA-binding Lrp family transcriptional regulator
MVTAIVLLNVARGAINSVAERLAEIDGISEVYSIGGRYDLAALIRVPSNDALAELVTGRMLRVEEITHSETLVAFRVFSRHDLERLFSVGMTGDPPAVRVPAAAGGRAPGRGGRRKKR